MSVYGICLLIFLMVCICVTLYYTSGNRKKIETEQERKLREFNEAQEKNFRRRKDERSIEEITKEAEEIWRIETEAENEWNKFKGDKDVQ